jgi:glycosyltransferase involved in cell wall biosynthesis
MCVEATYPPAVVALAGARDHYQLPLALQEGDLLEALVTDAYWPADRSWFAPLKVLLPTHLLQARVCAGLPSSRVKVVPGAMAAAAIAHATKGRRWGPSAALLNRHKDRLLGKTAGQLAVRSHAGLFCYSYYAYDAFRIQEGGEGYGEGYFAPRPEYRFLFQVHPHPQAVRQILLDELEAVPQASDSLEREYELGLPTEELARLAQEPMLANGWVAASSYTAQTLAAEGIPTDRIHVVPYGVDSQVFTRRASSPDPGGPLKVIYVGSLVQRKGLTYLLEAVRLLNTKSLEVVLCGRGYMDEALLAGYRDVDIQVNHGLPTSQLVLRIQASDLLAFPSLAEGFGHVVLESMSCGVPVVATSHTCGPDVMVDGEHGFIIPLRDSCAIAEKLAWGLDHRSELAAMGRAAADRARLFTWARFRQGIRDAYKGMIEKAAAEYRRSSGANG